MSPSALIQVPLHTVADVIDPHPSHRAPGRVNQGIPFIGIGDLSKNTHTSFPNARMVSRSIFDEHAARYDLQEGLLGLGRVASVGLVVDLPIPDLDSPYVVSPTLAIIKAKSIDKAYLKFQLMSPQVQLQLDALKQGSGRESVGVQKLRNVLIHLPPLDEQRRIVETLDDHLSRLDNALAEVGASLLKFETLERSARALHFSTSDESGGIKQSRIADVTEKAKSIDPKNLGLDTFRYVDIGSISPDSETPQVLEWTPADAAPSRARQQIKSGDVVFSTVRPYQKKIAIVKKDLDGHIASTGFCVLRPIPSVLDTRYLYHYLKSDALMDQVLPLQRGASYPAVGDSDVKNSNIPLPELATQRAIADALDSVVGRVKSLKSQLQDISKTAETMRRSILHSAFSGTLSEEK
jgi:type I restriction enzyme, S subunit